MAIQGPLAYVPFIFNLPYPLQIPHPQKATMNSILKKEKQNKVNVLDLYVLET